MAFTANTLNGRSLDAVSDPCRGSLACRGGKCDRSESFSAAYTCLACGRALAKLRRRGDVGHPLDLSAYAPRQKVILVPQMVAARGWALWENAKIFGKGPSGASATGVVSAVRTAKMAAFPPEWRVERLFEGLRTGCRRTGQTRGAVADRDETVRRLRRAVGRAGPAVASSR